MTNEQIAQVCHEANRGYCEAIGDTTQKTWDRAQAWQRDSAIKGVEFALANPTAPPWEQHQAWMAEKFRTGWKYGPVKDALKKEHPCLVSYEALPVEQRLKDALFKHVVAAFAAEAQTV